MRPSPTAYVPSGTAFLAASMRRCAGLAMMMVRGAPDEGDGVDQEPESRGVDKFAGKRKRLDHNGARMSTRMLILLAALCAVAILAASAIQILIAR